MTPKAAGRLRDLGVLTPAETSAAIKQSGAGTRTTASVAPSGAGAGTAAPSLATDAGTQVVSHDVQDGERVVHPNFGNAPGTIEQVGNDLYYDSNGDGVADVVWQNAHLSADGYVTAGAPPPGAGGERPGAGGAQPGDGAGTNGAPMPVADDAETHDFSDREDGQQVAGIDHNITSRDQTQQIGNDLYIDSDGDGAADLIMRNAHLKPDGRIVAGPPPGADGGLLVGAEPGSGDQLVGGQPTDGAGSGPGLVVDDRTQRADGRDFGGDGQVLDGYVTGGWPPPGHEQVGNSVYIDSDGDGTADVIVDNVHVSADGHLVAGQPGAGGDTAGRPRSGGGGLGGFVSGLLGGGTPAAGSPQQTQGQAAAQPPPAVEFDPDGIIAQLTRLKGQRQRGEIGARQYEDGQLAVLAGVQPNATGVEVGLKFLRYLSGKALITDGPYAVKREEMLAAL
ncbi:MAG: hypothetical protein QNJ94_15130 [Alphaproteobacteria bacterium]|nr:hypothetical protein [Alphaproteobacteria bacterium]